MQITTIEGVIENGKVKLTESFDLPDDTVVYVVVPNLPMKKNIKSPKLVNPSDISKFEREIFEIDENEV